MTVQKTISRKSFYLMVSLQETFQRKELWQLNNPKAQAITKLIRKTICLDLQPYCIVEDKGFTRLLNNFAPNYTIPSRKYFSTKVIPLMYDTIKAKVKYELDQADFLSLPSDGWTCQHTIQSYYSLTARFVTQEFTVKHVILQVTHLPESHTGHNISKFIYEALQSWEIPHEKIYAVLTDKPANLMAAIKESNLGDKHLPCLIHTLQLCIQKKIFREQRKASDATAIF
nr:E3 SUMO-protein ligase ZBED1-like [Hydra vulgaris]